jgi:hypothetical protein
MIVKFCIYEETKLGQQNNRHTIYVNPITDTITQHLANTCRNTTISASSPYIPFFMGMHINQYLLSDES